MPLTLPLFCAGHLVQAMALRMGTAEVARPLLDRFGKWLVDLSWKIEGAP